MVNRELISKTFDNIIEIKHSNFLYNIEGTLRQITDSKEEYKMLKNDIWRFWIETKNSDHEEIILKGTDGSFFENHNGNAHHVKIPDGVKEFISDGGELMYMVHNHPFADGSEGCCFQSNQDIHIMADNEVKYMISTGEDGIMIIKNPNCKYMVDYDEYSKLNLFPLLISQRYEKVFKKIEEGYHNDYKDKISALKQKYDIDNKPYDELEEYRMENNELLNEYISKHMGDFVHDLSNEFEMSEEIESNCYYVPRSPRIY